MLITQGRPDCNHKAWNIKKHLGKSVNSAGKHIYGFSILFLILSFTIKFWLRRLNSKAPQSLTRTWRVDDENAEKSACHYQHESALLDILPLSDDAKRIRDEFEIPKSLPSLKDCRGLVLSLPKKDRTAHAFQRVSVDSFEDRNTA